MLLYKLTKELYLVVEDVRNNIVLGRVLSLTGCVVLWLCASLLSSCG